MKSTLVKHNANWDWPENPGDWTFGNGVVTTPQGFVHYERTKDSTKFEIIKDGKLYSRTYDKCLCIVDIEKTAKRVSKI